MDLVNILRCSHLALPSSFLTRDHKPVDCSEVLLSVLRTR